MLVVCMLRIDVLRGVGDLLRRCMLDDCMLDHCMSGH